MPNKESQFLIFRKAGDFLISVPTSFQKISSLGFRSGEGGEADPSIVAQGLPALLFLSVLSLTRLGLLTCAWPGRYKQQRHNLQGPGPLQSSKVPSGEE